MIDYIIRFIIGGSIITLIHYYGKLSNTKIIALLPFIPVYFLIAYFYICKNGKKKINSFLFNLLIYLAIYAIFVISVIFIYNCSNNIYIPVIISYVIWITLIINIQKYLN